LHGAGISKRDGAKTHDDRRHYRPHRAHGFQGVQPAGRRSYPVEVGVGIPETGEVRSWLIKPEPDWIDAWDWYYEAERIHRLTRGHLLAHGLPRAQVARELSAFLGDREVVSDNPAEGYWLDVLFGEEEPQRVSSLALLYDATGAATSRTVGPTATSINVRTFQLLLLTNQVWWRPAA